MFVLTSNKHKVKEYQDFGLDARLGPDRDEVLGTMDEVIIHKILSVPSNVLVEDTILKIAGQSVVDVKFKLREAPTHEEAIWITSLGYHDNVFVYIFRGVINGTIVPPMTELDKSFEPCFVPAGSTLTLLELKQKGEKSRFSARRLAVDAFRNDQPAFVVAIADVPAWDGKYQPKN